MLEQLFGSRTRAKLLHLFLENVSRSFFVREICRAINERINSVRRELDNLEKFGLITFQTKEQKKFYQINQDFPVYNELKALIAKSKLLAQRILDQKAQKLIGLRYLALTGQFTDEENVQTDVLLVGRIPREALEKFIKELEKIYRREIRYTYFSTQEFNLRKDLTDKFLYSIINSNKVVLVNKLGI